MGDIYATNMSALNWSEKTKTNKRRLILVSFFTMEKISCYAVIRNAADIADFSLQLLRAVLTQVVGVKKKSLVTFCNFLLTRTFQQVIIPF